MNGLPLAFLLAASLAVAGSRRGSRDHTGRKSVKKIFEAWEDGRALGSAGAKYALWTDGTRIYSYDLVLAERRASGETVIWRWGFKDCTPTTGRHVSALMGFQIYGPRSVNLKREERYAFDVVVDDPMNPPKGYEPPNTPQDLGVACVGERSGRGYRKFGLDRYRGAWNVLDARNVRDRGAWNVLDARNVRDRDARNVQGSAWKTIPRPLAERVAREWLAGNTHHGRQDTLWTDGTRIYSYKLVLAEKRGKKRVLWCWRGITPTTNGHVDVLLDIQRNTYVPLLTGGEKSLFTDVVRTPTSPPVGLEPPNTPRDARIPPLVRSIYRGPHPRPGIRRPRRGGLNGDAGG
jgi:hypothetical protein